MSLYTQLKKMYPKDVITFQGKPAKRVLVSEGERYVLLPYDFLVQGLNNSNAEKGIINIRKSKTGGLQQ